MLTALTIDNQKIDADDAHPHTIAFCQNCGHRLHPACVTPGNTYLKNPYFFHDVGVDCDEWYEAITDWHKEWQSVVPLEQREISIEKGNVYHIADIFLPLPNVVIELQHSQIPFNTKLKRDAFYNKIIWFIHHSLQNSDCFKNSIKPVFIDLCDGRIQTPFGNTIPKEEFISTVLLNPALCYEDWTYGFDGTYIHIGLNKKVKIDDLKGKGQLLAFRHRDGSITIQCPTPTCDFHRRDYKRRPKKDYAHLKQNELIKANDDIIFYCPCCKNLYLLYVVPFNTKGEDSFHDLLEGARKKDIFFGKKLRRLQHTIQQQRETIKKEDWIWTPFINEPKV